MNVLIIGSGGREHAIVWKLRQSPKVDKIYCAPGNGGIGDIAQLVDIAATDIEALVSFVKTAGIDFTIVGMEDPLALGIVDVFESHGLRIFGPRKNAAILEASKEFSKDFMSRYNIPTARYEVFSDGEKAIDYLEHHSFPQVIKADGLAGGKGVVICEDIMQARQTVKEMLIDGKFGRSGKKIVIEEFLTGTEVSILAFVDGKTIIPMISAQDHKKAFDNDLGPNTGGMGAFAPSSIYSVKVAEICYDRIFEPTVLNLAKEGRVFKGIIFFGLIITDSGPKVIEYNVRFGDPETQAVLPMLENDLLEILEACESGTLDKINIKWIEGGSVCVNLASDGYPGNFEKGFAISGLEKFEKNSDIIVFHAGTKKNGNAYFTNGGRVLGITSTGADVREAANKSYAAITEIHFEGMFFRKDIGLK